MDLLKQKRIRLKGAKLKELNELIHERDNYACIIKGCSNYVPITEKWHHEPCGTYKEDVIEKGCLLCYYHHQQREGNDSTNIKEQCIEYLNNLYNKEGDL